MESFFDSQSLSTVTSSSTPHTPSPPMDEAVPVDYGFEPPAQYYLDCHPQSHPQLPQQPHAPFGHHQQPTESRLMETSISHPSNSTSAPSALYRRASFPFVHHDHPMSHSGYPRFVPQDGYMPEYEYEGSVKLEHASASAMVVPTQLPPAHPQSFYRPSSSSSSVSSVSGLPPAYLNPAISSIPIMHTDDASSKETQYLRRKCFNCATTEPPSWRRSTLNPGKIVCNKCGLYERTHNKPRPHQFGLRPGNKARKQQHPIHAQQRGPSPSLSPKRHGLLVKKEPLDYSQAMRRGSIASINSGSGTSDWDDHSGYSTTSSAYPSSLGMGPPSQTHSLSHHHSHQPHGPNHHGHHPYNTALSIMPPPRSASNGIRLPQAPPMKIPTKAGSSSPVTNGTGVIPGTLASNSSATPSPGPGPGPVPAAPAHHDGSSYGAVPPPPPPSIYGRSGGGGDGGDGGNLRSPSSILPSPDYYARRGSTSQIPHHNGSHYHQDHLAAMRRGSVGALGAGMNGMNFTERRAPPPPLPPLPSASRSGWPTHAPQAGASALNSATPTPMPVPLSDMSVTPTPVGAASGYNSAGSTPRRSYGTGDLTPSPPLQTHPGRPMSILRGVPSTNESPICSNIPPEAASLAA